MQIEMSLKEIGVVCVCLEEALANDLIGGVEYREICEKLNKKFVKMLEEMEVN